MFRISLLVLLCTASLTFAQSPPATPAADADPAAVPAAVPAVDPSSGPAPGATPPAVPEPQDPPAPGRITGIETDRGMIAAEARTEIVINGNAGAHCGLRVEFGDGTSTGILVSDASPFPVRVAHTYPKTADPLVRVTGTGAAGAIPCLGAVDAIIHVSPAGSKIEYITLSTSCPEGWLLRGEINADKSFSCAPVADVSAPTNLIHCIDGMKYFARAGNIGCMHPAVGIPQEVVTVAPARGGRMKGGRQMGMTGAGGPCGMTKQAASPAKAKPAATAKTTQPSSAMKEKALQPKPKAGAKSTTGE